VVVLPGSTAHLPFLFAASVLEGEVLVKRSTSIITAVTVLTLVVTLFTAVGAAAAPDDPPWTDSTLLPEPEVVRFDTEVHNGKMYMLGFRRGTAGTTDGSIWVLDLATQVWSDTGVDMPVPVSNYSIAKLTDANGVGLYVFGGRDDLGLCTTTVQVYYPDTNATATLAADPWAGQVNGATVFPGGVEVVGNKAYAWGGFCGGTTAPYVGSDTYIFDPMAAAGSRWTAGPSLPSGGAYQASAALDGKVFSIGGDTFDGAALNPYPDVLMLDPANLGAGWQTKAPLPTPSSGTPGCDESRAFGFDTASGWSLAGQIVLAGCGQWPLTPTTLPESFLYTGATDSWTTFASLNHARRNHAGAFIVDASGLTGRMWVGGGYIPDGTNLGTNTTETYDVTRQPPTAVTLEEFSGAPTSNMLLLVGLGAVLVVLLGVALRGVTLRP
jgi:hypothetical protein